MRRTLTTAVFVVSAVLILAGPAAAFEFCLGSGNTRFKFEVTPQGNFFALNGRESSTVSPTVSPATGTAYLTPTGLTAVLGFTVFQGNNAEFWHVELPLPTLLNGPYTIFTFTPAGVGTTIPGTASALPCTASL